MRALIAACVLMGGCTGQFVPQQTLDKVGLSVMQRAGEITIASEQQAAAMQPMGEIVGHSCKNQVLVGEADSTRVGAIDQLRIVAAQKGADAISAPSCKQGGFSPIKNCWNSWECKAVALKSPD